MIIALPVMSDEKSAKVSKQCARSAFFAIINKSNLSYRIVENPFANNDKEVGKSVFDELCLKYGVDTIMGFELGYKMYQLTFQHKLNVILLNKSDLTLDQVMLKMKL